MKVTIIDADMPPVRYSDLGTGEVYRWGGGIYMKTDLPNTQAPAGTFWNICLDNGVSTWMCKDNQVERATYANLGVKFN